MKASQPLVIRSTGASLSTTIPPSTVRASKKPSPFANGICQLIRFRGHGRASSFHVSMSARVGPHVTSGPVLQSDSGSVSRIFSAKRLEAIEESIEKIIYRCRFLAFMGVLGSLIGSFLCFIKGCSFVATSFGQYFVNRGKVIMLLVEAIDVYLLGTVMLVFGMGLYELFVSNLEAANSLSKKVAQGSLLFGLFTLKERPKWLGIKTVNELKTKLGHVIVMLLLIGLFEKSKKAVIQSPIDLLCFSASILLSSGSLFLLSKLTD